MLSAILLDTISAASNRTSGIYDLGDLRGYSMECIFTGSNIVGSAVLQVSRTQNDADFVTVAGSTTTTSSSNPIFYDVTVSSARYVRLKWTATSGTGNITVTIDVKEAVTRLN